MHCVLFCCCFSTGDFNRQLMNQMVQMNQILGEVKDLLKQQVLYEDLIKEYPKLCDFSGVSGEFVQAVSFCTELIASDA